MSSLVGPISGGAMIQMIPVSYQVGVALDILVINCSFESWEMFSLY